MNPRIAKTLVALAAAVLVALPVVASAQTARVQGMAIQGDYIKDYTNALGYPGCISGVGNLVYGELGSLTAPNTFDRGVGAVLGNLWEGRVGTWGVFLREEATQLGGASSETPVNPGTDVYGSDPNTNTNSSFDIEWGKQFGTMRLGARLRRAYFENDYTTPAGVTTTLKYDPTAAASNLGKNLTGIGLGAQWEWGGGTMAEFGFHYDNRTFSVVPGDFEEDNAPNYMFNARLFWQWQPNITLVPVFKWYSFDVGTRAKAPAAPATTEGAMKGWQAGVAGNWTLGTDDLFVLGVTMANNTVEQDATIIAVPSGATSFTGTATDITETFTPEVFAALETHVNPWLTLRFGARNGAWHTIKVSDDATDEKQEIKDSPFLMTLGAGVKVGTLQFDGVVNDLFPFTAGYLFSGASAGPAFYKLSATYAF
jgi:hypothetical protein